MRSITLLATLLLSLLSANAVSEPLPMDSAVRHGRLANGLTYYICPNTKTSQRTDFYIVQKVGSMQEEEHQRGLAHFLEHMAFNGTKHFPEKSLIRYLESLGLQFGNDINAYTSFDETVYSITNVPTLRTGVADSCLLILHDWSCNITLSGKEIDAERKVIHEEWRSKRGMRDRIYEQTLPKLFPDSNRYAHRMPIGLMSVVDNFPHKALRDYYKKWYRPDLQAIIIVGDINADYIEKAIRSLWSTTKGPSNPAERIYYKVADNQSPIVAIATDNQLSSSMASISYNYDPLPANVTLSAEGVMEEYCRNMILQMLTMREADKNSGGKGGLANASPALSYNDGDYSLARTKKAFSATTYFNDSNWQKAIHSIVYELKRTMEHGFTAEEYQRATDRIKSWVQYAEGTLGKTKLSNAAIAQKCKQHFLLARPLISDATEISLYKQALNNITLEQINNRFSQYLYSSGGLAIQLHIASSPNTVSSAANWIKSLDNSIVLSEYGKAWQQPTIAHKIPETTPRPVLMPHKPAAGSIVKETYNKLYNTRELLLSNGAKVILKHNDTGRDEIRITAFSHGGTSMMSDADYYNFSAINTLPSLGGLAHLTGEQLGRALEGNSASYQTNITALTETFTGSCEAADAEQLLQLLHLRFTTVKKDTAAFLRWQNYMRSSLQRQLSNPMRLFGDTLRSMMYSPHIRSRATSLAQADSVDYDRTCQLFLERFANASDFSFIIVGNINGSDSLEKLICQYIASLPSQKGKTEKGNIKTMPQLSYGSKACRIAIAMPEPSTTVVCNIMADCKYTPRYNIACAILNQVMDIRCSEQLREKMGGTYNVSVTARISREPKEQATIMYNFTTNAQQAEPLLDAAKEQLSLIAEKGITPAEMSKAIENLKKRHDEYRAANAFWLSAITERERHGTNHQLLYHEALQSVTAKDVNRIARILAKSKNITQVIMDGE